MLLVGLTGGIGSGKSTVATLLAERGAAIVDADRIAREVVEPGGPAYQPMIDRFGPGIVLPDGTLDRAAIAAQAFATPDALADLNAITHPAIRATMAERVARHAASGRVVVVDIPLLAEGGPSAYGLRGVIVVDAPVEVAIHRLVEGRGLTEADARARVAAQASREDRRKLADVVIDNAGSREDLVRQVDEVWAWIEALR
ncbi:MAG TPA: dephospho-CoA kinase [Acidimicrobiales bacterium]|nr:dephospho-CoA kinase [Acidimicrobiales bacterium]